MYVKVIALKSNSKKSKVLEHFFTEIWECDNFCATDRSTGRVFTLTKDRCVVKTLHEHPEDKSLKYQVFVENDKGDTIGRY